MLSDLAGLAYKCPAGTQGLFVVLGRPGLHTVAGLLPQAVEIKSGPGFQEHGQLPGDGHQIAADQRRLLHVLFSGFPVVHHNMRHGLAAEQMNQCQARIGLLCEIDALVDSIHRFGQLSGVQQHARAQKMAEQLRGLVPVCVGDCLQPYDDLPRGVQLTAVEMMQSMPI